MGDRADQSALTVKTESSPLYNKTSQLSAIQRGKSGAADYVPHLTIEEVRRLAMVAEQNKRHGERNGLLIKFPFDSCSRVSEMLKTRPIDFHRTAGGWTVQLFGKGSKPGIAAISASLAAEIQSYCYRYKIADTDCIFPISRSQVFRIVSDAFIKAGIRRPEREIDHVGAVHILRHSGAIERLRQTGNPKAVQDQLRHKSAYMTLRYLKTLSQEESLKIQQGVDFQW